MSSQTPTIRLQVQLGPDDYARYVAVAGKRQSTWIDLAIYTSVFFMAFPASLLFKVLATRESDDALTIEMIGRFTLIAFFAGLATLILALWAVRRRAIGTALSATPNAFDEKSVVLDEHDISITGKLSQARWSWPAITGITAEQGLVLFWVGSQSAVMVPDRAFTTIEARDEAIAFARARIVATSSMPGRR